MPHTSTRPRSTVTFSHELATNVRRTYGHEPYCACGWVGKLQRTAGEAQWEAKVHRHKEHRV